MGKIEEILKQSFSSSLNLQQLSYLRTLEKHLKLTLGDGDENHYEELSVICQTVLKRGKGKNKAGRFAGR